MSAQADLEAERMGLQMTGCLGWERGMGRGWGGQWAFSAGDGKILGLDSGKGCTAANEQNC